jgi:osmotically inducible protein OsmC
VATTKRRADAVWEGSLNEGKGRVDFNSGAVRELPVTWAARTESPDGKTSPEELIAAAHATCFSMALSNILAGEGSPPDWLEVSATCTLNLDPLKISNMDLEVRGAVPGIDADGFEEAAVKAKDGCPVSGALKNNLEITVQATLA